MSAPEDLNDVYVDELKELIAGQDEKVSKEHCKGMEGLAAEATKHVLEEGPEKGSLLDVLISEISAHDALRHRGIRHCRCLCHGARP